MWLEYFVKKSNTKTLYKGERGKQFGEETFHKSTSTVCILCGNSRTLSTPVSSNPSIIDAHVLPHVNVYLMSAFTHVPVPFTTKKKKHLRHWYSECTGKTLYVRAWKTVSMSTQKKTIIYHVRKFNKKNLIQTNKTVKKKFHGIFN